MDFAVIPSVVQQHADEVPVLWRMRQTLLRSDEADLTDLVGIDGQIAAHLDGLRLAGDHGWNRALALFADDPEPATMLALTHLALCDESGERMEGVLAGLAEDTNLARGAAAGLCWHGGDYTSSAVDPLLTGKTPQHHLLGLEACAMAGLYPERRIATHLAGPPAVRAAALRLAGWGNLRSLAPAVQAPQPDDDDACRAARAIAATLLSDGGAVAPGLLELAGGGGPDSEQALALMAMKMSRAGVEKWLSELPYDTPGRQLQLRTAGYVGDPDLVPWLIEKSEEDELHNDAAGSIRRITGVRLEDLDFDDGTAAPLPNPFAAPGAAQDTPEANGLKRWWSAAAPPPGSGIRVLGQEPTQPALAALLSTAKLCDRDMVTLRARLAFGAAPAFACDAPVSLQTR